MAATNGTHHPDRFEIAARTWVARASIISDCSKIVEQVGAPPGRGPGVTLGLRHHLDDMRDADRDGDEAAWYAAVADFLTECVEIRAPGGVEDRL